MQRDWTTERDFYIGKHADLRQILNICYRCPERLTGEITTFLSTPGSCPNKTPNKKKKNTAFLSPCLIQQN